MGVRIMRLQNTVPWGSGARESEEKAA
jgi:hypothetical protein